MRSTTMTRAPSSESTLRASASSSPVRSSLPDALAAASCAPFAAWARTSRSILRSVESASGTVRATITSAST